MRAPLSVRTATLWGKTGRVSSAVADEAWHPLFAHALDSAEVAGWLWDHFLAPSTRRLVSQAVPGQGRTLLQWLAALHDLGKATPAFQAQSPLHASAVRAAGLRIQDNARAQARPHAAYSARLLPHALAAYGWNIIQTEWPSLILGGHHGVFPGTDWHSLDVLTAQVGDEPWAEARAELVRAVADHLGVDMRAWRGVRPSLPAQLVLSGAVILADWLASNDAVCGYVGSLPPDYALTAAAQAAAAGRILDITGAWRPGWFQTSADLYGVRFPRIQEPRGLQSAAFEMAANAAGSGLLLIEAPMGEGKTEAALAAAEVLAAATGASGIFVGLPTQATANQMFSRVLGWLRTNDHGATVTLAHGKARRVQQYARLLSGQIGVDEHCARLTASQWTVGAKKALLSPVVVGTVDQLLFAGVSARHVALRHLGVAGKVVVIDEVHAMDVYMSRILHRVLRWLGAAGIPVILLSATLAAGQRAELLAEYARRPVTEPGDRGYPRLTWIPADPPAIDPEPDLPPWIASRPSAVTAEVMRPPADPKRRMRVEVRYVSEPNEATVPDLVAQLLRHGGSALVLRNTVGRAQRTYDLLRRRLGNDRVSLAHARYTVADRRARDNALIADFGPEASRPSPHVTVATQVAEQSLDVDYDVLISDLAPIDLLFQRIGRMHRHSRPVDARPKQLRTPRVFVVGHEHRPDQPPTLPRGSRYVYGDHLLLRTAAVLHDRPRLDIPGDVPVLVDTVYGDEPVGPSQWRDALADAARRAREELDRTLAIAETVLLGPPDAESLAEVQRHRAEVLEESNATTQAVVRLGPPTIEVLLLRDTPRPDTAKTVSHGPAVRIPLDRVPPPHLVDVVLDQLIRLPAAITEAANAEAVTVPAWAPSPWLAEARLLRLPVDGSPLLLGDWSCSYSPARGLEAARVRSQ